MTEFPCDLPETSCDLPDSPCDLPEASCDLPEATYDLPDETSDQHDAPSGLPETPVNHQTAPPSNPQKNRKNNISSAMSLHCAMCRLFLIQKTLIIQMFIV